MKLTLKEAHEKALSEAWGYPADLQGATNLVSVYLSAMSEQGYRLLPVEATEEMIDAVVHEECLDVIWRKAAAAFPEMEG